MGEVYLARDTKLGRRVALKVIRHGRLPADRKAVSRFLEEARITASFSHPNIVTVYGVGEYEGNPYLALEYVEGETLRQRMNKEAVPAREVMRTGMAIAQALAEAHRNRVLHRDLKPENVILARDGRLRILDLGLAMLLGDATDKTALASTMLVEARARAAEVDAEALDTLCDPHSTPAGVLQGTPFYIAPEGWRGQPVTEAVDVWALGVVLHELLLGRRPYQHTLPCMFPLVVATEVPVPAVSGPGIPDELAALVDRCLDKEPGRRPTAAEVANRLEGMLRWRHLEGERNPFRGLLAFGERHADLFFGRDAEVTAFLESLRDQPVVAVVGPSGAGKSSFVQAGVIARMRERGNLALVQLRPGSEPFETLARQLQQRGDGESFPDTSDPSRRGREANLLVEAAQIGGVSGPVPVTVEVSGGDRHSGEVDLDVAAATATSANLKELATQLRENPRLLNVLLHELAAKTRSKVLLFVDQLEEVFTLVAENEVRRRFVEAVCKAVEEPASPVRAVFTVRDDFLGRVMAGTDVGTALDRVVVLRRPGRAELAEMLGRPVAMAGYSYEDPALLDEMAASIEGEPACLPLVQFAAQLLWEKRDRARRLILRAAYQEMGGIAGALAEHADGVLAGLGSEQVQVARELLLALVTPEGTRRVVAMREIEASQGGAGKTVLGRLAQARLITIRRGRTGETIDAVAELAHESLIRTWGQLARWLEESKEDREFLAEAQGAAEQWEKRGRRDEELWQGKTLDESLVRLERCQCSVPEAVRRFLASGSVKKRRWRQRRRVAMAIGVSLLAVVAVVSTVREREVRRQ
ncbi:MAG: serine/threonine-protein kinase, partial [Pseudomonadota bacterium]